MIDRVNIEGMMVGSPVLADTTALHQEAESTRQWLMTVLLVIQSLARLVRAVA